MQVIDLKLTHTGYNIYIQDGILSNIANLLPDVFSGSKIAIITDSNVSELYLSELSYQLAQKHLIIEIVVPAGEESKRLEVAANIYNKLSAAHISRSDLIVALGGGVVGDLAGFVAATYMRGIPFVQIPTSLLAQVDSSIGGKVAVDIPSGKNLVGAFYQPKAVYIDPNVLNTLTDRFYYDGLAEVIKYACIKDAALFETLKQLGSREQIQAKIQEIVIRCLNTKKHYVQLDEFDTGERMFLNYGHTIGHAVEKYFDFSSYTHGECVAMGMAHITKRSEALGLTNSGVSRQLERLLIQYRLPYHLPESSEEFTSALLHAVAVDKKNLNKKLNLVLIKDIGESFLHRIDSNDMNKFI